MNQAGWMLVASFLAPVLTVLTVIYFAGQFTQRMRDQERRTDDHDDVLESHAKRINRHDVELADVRGFQRGLRTGMGKPVVESEID